MNFAPQTSSGHSANEPMDGTLVTEARRGDGSAFDQLVRRHYRMAYHTALRVLDNPSDAEDVCQDAFLRALKHLDSCREPDRFAAWLSRIVRNIAISFRHARTRRATTSLDDLQVAGAQQVAVELELGELRETLRAAIERLNPPQREALMRYDVDGWDHRAIAESLKVSEGMSRQYLFQARRRLRELLGGDLAREYQVLHAR